MTLVVGVPVSVVQIVDVVAVLDGLVAATLAVDVRVLGRLVLGVFFRSGHGGRLLETRGAARLAGNQEGPAMRTGRPGRN
jgi:hypothetical protein